jgi:hypothetical protein
MYQWRMRQSADNTDLLELVREIPADEMKLPIKNKRWSRCPPTSPPAAGTRRLSSPSSQGDGQVSRGRHGRMLETQSLTIRSAAMPPVDGVTCALFSRAS